MSNNYNKYLFKEIQRFTHVGVWLPVVAVAAAVIWLFLQQVVFDTPVGKELASDLVLWVILILVGIGLPWFMHAVRLETTVAEDHILVRFWPLSSRTIYHKDIKSYGARDYRPIREYGGWGIRCSRKNGRAYSISGSKGLQLELADGKKVLIGSQKADEFERILKTVTTRR